MLARTEEAFRESRRSRSAQEVSAVRAALLGLFDYAGLFPPAQLALTEALARYRQYGEGEHAEALARLVVSFPHLAGLAAAHSIPAPDPLSITGPFDAPWHEIQRLQGEGLRVQMVEVKIASAEQVRAIRAKLPDAMTIYYEVSFDSLSADLLSAISLAGGRAKLRIGGAAAEAFPAPLTLAEALQLLAKHELGFKATAGLHHPLRSIQPLTNQQSSARCFMHGFVNLMCAATLIHLGGTAQDAEEVLMEEDPAAFLITRGFIQWQGHRWSTAQLREVRQSFLMSIGSCSFTEPMDELEALGWL